MMVGSPGLLLLALFAAIACLAIARRRLRVAICLAAAVFAGFAAAADVRLLVDRPPVVAVLVDVSPSTRGFSFRDAATARRIASDVAARLAPGAELRFLTFAQGDPISMGDVIAEQPADDTRLQPVEADAVLLLSDGRIDVSASMRAPVFPIATREAQTNDARLVGTESSGDRVVIQIVNDGPPRSLTWPDGTTSPVPHGTSRLSHAAPIARGTVRLDAGDLWPENDAIEIAPSTQVASERWWIGTSNAPAGYRAIAPNSLPPAESWLAAKEVVLDNMPGDAFDARAMRTLSHYVRDLGGSLVIVGGDHAFSAGGYGGTELDVLSPLASQPPEPRREWLVLIDASGSMAAMTDGGRPRLDVAIDAASALVASLPASDSVGVASFARELRTWPVQDTRHVVAPADLVANGPTNLALALKTILLTRKPGPGVLPLRVIVLTDGDADMSGFDADMARVAKDAAMTIDWMRLDNTELSRPLSSVAIATGGSVVDLGEPSHWSAHAVATVRSMERIEAATMPTSIQWREPLAGITDTLVPNANRTWVRKDAEVLAFRVGDDDIGRSPIAARWRVGEGRVVALAFAASPPVTQRAADLVAASPRDPKFAVSWDGRHVTIDAAEAGAPLNDLAIDVRDVDTAAGSMAFKQTAPGRYEATLDTDASVRTIATRVAGRMIDLHIVAGSPVEEFSAIGIDRAALEKLAARTGGRVIDRDRPDGPPIVARRERPIGILLLLTSLASMAAAIVFGRR